MRKRVKQLASKGDKEDHEKARQERLCLVTCVACSVETSSVGSGVGRYVGTKVGLPWSLAGFRVGMPARQSVGW